MTDQVSNRKNHKGWTGRGYLPHCDYPGLIQSVTIRLFDSVPANVLELWNRELEFTASGRRRNIIQKRIDEYNDAGFGACFLADPSIAKIAENSLRYFDRQRYELLAWCIMPNHVHVLFAQLAGFPLAQVVHSWKSFSSKQANLHLNRKGAFWARDYFDQFMKTSDQFESTIAYIEQNPVNAGLVDEANMWAYSSASATNLVELKATRERYGEIDVINLPLDNARS